MQKQLFEKVKDNFNLNAYEAKVYASLLSRGICSAGQLSDISGVPRSRCYDVLEALEKKGFVFQKIGKPIRYIPVHPDEVVDTLKKNAKIEEQRLLSLYDSISKTEDFLELQSLYDTGISYIDNNEISNSIIGRNNINNFLKDMIDRSERNITIHTTRDGLKRKMRLLKKANTKAITKIYSPYEKDASKKNIVHIRKDTGLRFVNVDDKEILFFTTDESADTDSETAVWLKSRFLIDSMNGFL